MKIGVISDTHKKSGRAKKAIDILVKNGAGFLVHAGDIGKEETLAYIESSGLPYVAVLGNNDAKLTHLKDRYNLFTEPHYFKIDGLKVKLMHHPWFLSPDADLIIFGHTHKFSARCDKEGRLFLNPGEACARNKPVSEAVLLNVTKNEWQILHLQRRIKEREWQYNNIIYERAV